MNSNSQVVKGATRIILAALSLALESMQAEGCWIHFYKDSAENIKKSRTNSPGIANVESSLKDNGGYSRSSLSKVVQNSPYAFLVETTNKVCKDIPQSGTQLRRNYGHDITSQITNRGLERTPLSVTGGSTLSLIATSIGERSTPGTSLTNETTKTTEHPEFGRAEN
ncbi:uncharacterized protein LOC108221070 isoform X5 [Daucus carota subsp. sativus]|uniref:uncharacterized protein LOC108221070 isoform X5 n=1 Tax=Daucus carota subsp. sativus TaxID=79200 RepID=UPI003082D02A